MKAVDPATATAGDAAEDAPASAKMAEGSQKDGTVTTAEGADAQSRLDALQDEAEEGGLLLGAPLLAGGDQFAQSEIDQIFT